VGGPLTTNSDHPKEASAAAERGKWFGEYLRGDKRREPKDKVQGGGEIEKTISERSCSIDNNIYFPRPRGKRNSQRSEQKDPKK